MPHYPDRHEWPQKPYSLGANPRWGIQLLFRRVSVINYKPKLSRGIFREILSAMWSYVNNDGIGEGVFEGHPWSYNPYGFYFDKEEFDSEEEISKWYNRLEAYTEIISDEAVEAIKQLQSVGVDARQWLSNFIFGEGVEVPEEWVIAPFTR